MVSAVVIVLGLSEPLAAQTDPSWFGIWRLNLGRSTSVPEPLPYKRGTRRIARSESGGITIIDDLVRSRGGILHLEWTGEFDGLDYPVQGVEVVLTNAYRRIDERTYELIQKVDGNVVATARLEISIDGQTITTIVSGQARDVTTIYDRQ